MLLVVVVPAAGAELAASRAPSTASTHTEGTQEAVAGVVEEFAHVFLTADRRGRHAVRGATSVYITAT